MATINTTVNGANGPQAAAFRVDPDKIPALIAQDEDARQELDRILTTVRHRKTIRPAGDDEVSKAAAQAIKELMGDAPGGLTKTVDDARRHISEQINKLKAAQQDYRAADESATPTQM